MNVTEEQLLDFEKLGNPINPIFSGPISYTDNDTHIIDDQDLADGDADFGPNAESGAYQRRQFFEISQQSIKVDDDESVCSHWESEFPTNIKQQNQSELPSCQHSHRSILQHQAPSNIEKPSSKINPSHTNNNKQNPETIIGSDEIRIHLKDTVSQLEDLKFHNTKNQIGLVPNQTVISPVNFNSQQNLPEGLKGQWKQSALLIITLVKKFQNMLMSHSNENKFRTLDKRHFEVIGDKSVFYPFYQKYKFNQDQIYKLKHRSQTANFFNKKKGLKKHILIGSNMSQLPLQTPQQSFGSFFNLECCFPFLVRLSVIQPNSRFRILWNILMTIVLFINFSTIPLKVAFETFQNQTNLQKWTYVSGVLFLLDMGISFNSAYFSKGLIITDRKKIIRNYVKKSFLVDFLVICGYILLQFSYLQIEAVVLMKVFKIGALIENFEEILNLRQRGQAILSLMKLIVFVVMVAHILGCSFFLVYRLEEHFFPNMSNWLGEKLSNNPNWYDQYIISLYWSVVTMITVGYGDITPVNTLERLFVICVMLISCGVFAYSLNSIGRILEELSRKDAIFRENISLLTCYLKQVNLEIEGIYLGIELIIFFIKKRGISYDLQLRIRKYFQYLHRENQEDNEKSESLINLLPSSLKNELGREMFVKIINDQKVFKLNFSQNFIQDLSLKMKEKRFAPEEIIFQERDYLDKLYFLIKGQIELYVNVKDSDKNHSTSVNFVNKGRLLGQNAFFSQLPSSTGARCINVASLVYISRDDFLDTIKKHSQDYEKFCMLRDNLQVNCISRGLGTKCHLCGAFNHQFQTCHLIRYSPMKEKVILKFNRMEQGRDPSFVRNQSRKPTSSSRIAHQFIKETTINYIIEFNPLDTEEEFIIETVENIRKYYTDEEQKWRFYEKDSIHKELSMEESPHLKAAQSFKEEGSSDPLRINNPGNSILQELELKKARKKKIISALNIDNQSKEFHSPSSSQNYPSLPNSPMKRRWMKSDQGLSSDSVLSSQPQKPSPQGAIVLEKVLMDNRINTNKTVTEEVTGVSAATIRRKSLYQHFRTTSMCPEKESKEDYEEDYIEIDHSDKSIYQKLNFKGMETIKSRVTKRRNNIILTGGLSGLLADQAELLKKNSFSDLMDLDRFMMFLIYFPEGNISRILEAYNNLFIHFKNKEEIELQKSRRNNKKLFSRMHLSNMDRSMNVLKTKIIQKRSRDTREGDNLPELSPLPLNKSLPLTNVPSNIEGNNTKGSYTRTVQQQQISRTVINLNQSVSFNDFLVKSEKIRQFSGGAGEGAAEKAPAQGGIIPTQSIESSPLKFVRNKSSQKTIISLSQNNLSNFELKSPPPKQK